MSYLETVPDDIKGFLKRTNIFISSNYQDKIIYYLSDREIKTDTEILHSPIFHDQNELFIWIRNNYKQLENELGTT
jgi:hypothetical protein